MRRQNGYDRWNVIMLLAVVSAAACDSSTGTTAPRSPFRIEATGPTVIAGIVGTDVTPPPAVRAVAINGSPVPGVTIRFEVANGGTIANATVMTDVNGMASVGGWTLGSGAGRQTLSVKSAGRTDIVFNAFAGAGPVAQIDPWTGNGQSAAVHQELPQRLIVRVSDSFGNPVTNATVTFAVIAGGGTITNSTVAADSNGLATSGMWMLGPDPGLQQVRAESGGRDVVFSATAFAAPLGLRGSLAFVSGVADDSEIFSINADGSGLRSLTASTGFNHAPSWSPDGRRIAFVSGRHRVARIYIMDADGSNLSALPDVPLYSTGAHELAWSPDAALIAFTLSDGDSRIATVSGDETVVLLTRTPGFNSQPSWSPDGRQIAFVSDRDAYDFAFNIYTMNADGSEQTLRTRGFPFWPEVAYYLHPAWSPDGSMIAFVYGSIINTSDMRFHVAIMSSAGAFIRDLAWAGDIPWMELLDPGSLTWSPDGSGIAFTFVDCNLMGSSSCSKVRSIRYVSIDGSRQSTIVSNAHSPSWRR